MKNLRAYSGADTASFRLLQELPYLPILHDEQNGWLYLNWRGDQTFDMVSVGSAAILHWAKIGKYTKLLNDNSNITRLSLPQAQWQQVNQLAELHQCGVHYIAWVESPHEAARSSVKTAIHLARYPIVLTFDSVGIAATWLRDV